MTLDEALGGDPDRIGDPGQALFVLRQEVRRLQAGVEAVRALTPCEMVTSSYHVGATMQHSDDGEWLHRADVLAALEATDD